jgi:peptide-methionine (S)-S-oxide reductase
VPRPLGAAKAVPAWFVSCGYVECGVEKTRDSRFSGQLRRTTTAGLLIRKGRRPANDRGAEMMKTRVLAAMAGTLAAVLISFAACRADSPSPAKSTKGAAATKAKSSNKTKAAASDGKTEDATQTPDRPGTLEEATFGSGCFWCAEAVFQRIKGVESVLPGYSGGHVKNPTYEQVCTKTTGHAEVVQITFDSSVVSYKDLLEVFWKSHDPTKLNRQGIDHGPQYRSVIFYHNDEQKELADHYKKELDKAHIFSHKIVTEVLPFKEFYQAEDYHLNYFNNNPDAEYCEAVILPKVNKIKKLFKEKVQ